ncbi:MAG: AbrB family transcriptional regulator [Rhizomicrobium sp.]|nr:AbrB family transcriptional regulator [Rhizomicrobium sp.]
MSVPLPTPTMRLAHKPAQWAVLLAGSVLLLLALEALHLPAALLLGPMIAGIAISAAGAALRVPNPCYLAAQALVGAMIARALPLSHLGDIFREWPVLLFGVGSTLLAAASLGWLLTRWRVLPGTTAIWGSAPGAASTMVVMAEAFGADVRLVAFMQYLRVMCVAGTASLIASLVMAHGGHTPPAINWFPAFDHAGFALTLILVLGSGFVAHRLKIPAGGLIVPMVVAGLMNNIGHHPVVLPPWLLALSYAVFGWSIGLRFTRAILLYAMRALPRLLLSILVLITLCAGFGALLSQLTGIDPLTAYLATSPGGADSVAIIAASSKVDMPFVMTMQMVRFLAVTVTGPALARFLAGKVPGSAG